jgi:hypothetical protein
VANGVGAVALGSAPNRLTCVSVLPFDGVEQLLVVGVLTAPSPFGGAVSCAWVLSETTTFRPVSARYAVAE